MVWGKISNGWISLDYVILDQPQQIAVTKTVTASCLRVRSSAGTDNTIVGEIHADFRSAFVLFGFAEPLIYRWNLLIFIRQWKMALIQKLRK